MPQIWLGLNNLDVEDQIKEKIYDDLDLDNVDIDLSKFDLRVEYKIDVQVDKITLEKKPEQH